MFDATFTPPSQGDFDKHKRNASQVFERAALATVGVVARRGSTAIRTRFQGAGLGRLGSGIGSSSDNDTGFIKRLSGSGFSVSAAFFIRRGSSPRTIGAIKAYTEGAEITPRNGRWLWIATDEIPRVTNRYRMTPALYRKNGFEQKIGPLIFIRSINGRPLLVVKDASVSAAGKPRSAKSLTKGGRLKKGQRAKDFIVAFIGIPRTARAARVKVGELGKFLAGLGGAAIFGAITVLGLLWESMREGEESAADLTKLIDFQKLSTSQMTKAIEALDDAQRRQNQTAQEASRITRENAEGALQSARSKLAEAQAEEKLAAAMVRSSLLRGDFAGAVGARLVEENRRYATPDLKENLADIERIARGFRFLDAKENAKAGTDPSFAVGRKFDAREAAVRDSFLGDKITKGEAERQLAALNKARERELDLIKDSERSLKTKEKSYKGDLAPFDLPFSASSISSGFGKRDRPTAGASANHGGIDFAQPFGTAVRAVQDGLVVLAKDIKGYGNRVEIDHGAGTKTSYSHLSSFNVAAGQRVSKGDLLGGVGSTGTSTGNHLHYEVQRNGRNVDPRGQFPTDAVAVDTNAAKAGPVRASRSWHGMRAR